MTNSTVSRPPDPAIRGWTDQAAPLPATEPQPTRPPSPDASRPADVVLGAAVIAMGLLAGLFFAFDVAVMPGLAAADDRTLVDAMQQMIDLPAFPVTLLAAPALAVVALVQARRSALAKTAGWIGGGLACYTLMLVVSVVVHFPLNDALMQAGNPDRIANLATVHDAFVTPWATWNVVRTVSLTAAFACLAWALVWRGRQGGAP